MPVNTAVKDLMPLIASRLEGAELQYAVPSPAFLCVNFFACSG